MICIWERLGLSNNQKHETPMSFHVCLFTVNWEILDFTILRLKGFGTTANPLKSKKAPRELRFRLLHGNTPNYHADVLTLA
jgi:hypothetical protein